jgi:hypothetical protein
MCRRALVSADPTVYEVPHSDSLDGSLSSRHRLLDSPGLPYHAAAQGGVAHLRALLPPNQTSLIHFSPEAR